MYKIKKGLEFAGVEYYKNNKDAGTCITMKIDSSASRKEAKILAEQLNKAMDNGRIEVLCAIAEVIRANKKSSFKNHLINVLEKQYKYLL